MNVKKVFVFLLILALALPALFVPAFAAEEPEFYYELTVDGEEVVEANPGDVITVTLYLYRTDADAPYTMHAMQDEIRYDSTFFELVEDSALLSQGIQSTDISVGGDNREFYMNYVSLSGGAQWETKTRVGSFQLKITGQSGVSTITNEDYLVSLPDGSGSYICAANVLTVVLTTDCTVRFETNGGTPIDPVTAIYGETIARPEDPTREGKVLIGWFKDIHLTEEWNFETDTVNGNMTLYAKWGDAPIVDPGSDSNWGVWSWLIVVVLILLVLILLLLLLKDYFVLYSLTTGDISLNYKDKEHDVEVEVVLFDGEKEYHLNKSGTVLVKHRLRFIRNATRMAITEIRPGQYDGKLIITGGEQPREKKCRIMVLDREIKEKENK